MPTPLKIIIALIVIGCCFAVYFVLMGDSGLPPQAPTKTVAAATKPATSPSGLGDGKQAWVTQFDKNGRESYRFKAVEYLPQKDGTFLVERPIAEFFLKGQNDVRTRLRITGKTGTVYIQQGTGQPVLKESVLSKKDDLADFGRPPRKGRLQDVTVQLVEGDDDAPAAITLTMNNAVFDNETYRIFTEAFKDENGKETPAEWVPVNVTGRYDFVGYGLTVRWNDLDQRLELLKVFHGEKLVIRDTSAFTGATAGASPAPKKTAKAGRNAPVLPAPADDAAAPVILAADTSPARPASPTTAAVGAPQASPYRAKFTEQVVIKQGDQTLAQADEMNVDFLLAGGGAKQKQPSEKKAGKDEAKATKKVAAKAAAPSIDPSAPAAAPEPTTKESVTAAATTQPAAEPITVYWHGPLEVTPHVDATAGQAPALKTGEAAVEFVGSPVLLTREGGEVQCASLVYRTGDGGSVSVRSSDRFPRVLVKQPVAAKPGQPAGPPATVSTTALDYSAATNLATLSGPSTARIPLPSDNPKPGQAPDIMEAEWSQHAKFFLLGDGGKDTSIDHADFAGDVRVKHPQLDLRSQQLRLAFVQGAAAGTTAADAKPGQKPSPVLNSIVASGRVQCDVVASNAQRQTVLCDRLSLKTATGPDGRVFPEIVDADGQVRAFDEKQELLAGHVMLTLAPAAKQPARPAAGGEVEDAAMASADEKAGPLTNAGGFGGGSIELRRMEAKENVRVRSADGAIAAGDALTIVSGGGGKGGDTEVRLAGRPARVEDKDHNTITGPLVVIHPDGGKAEIEGAGTIDAVQKDEKDPQAPGRKVHIAWANRADVNGPEDLITVDGNVLATMPDRDGAMNTAHSQRVEITLVKKLPPSAATEPGGGVAATLRPPRPPSLANAATKPAATKPSDAVAGRAHVDFFKDKQVGEVTLLDEAVINSKQQAPDGSVLREFQMQASRIGFDLPRHKVTVPVGGQMLVRDHRPSEPPSGTAAGKPGQAPQPGEGKGISAFQWSKSLTYDESTRQATMAGDVIVVHKPDGAGQFPVRLQADQVVAAFLPTEVPKAAGTTVPATKAAADAPDLTAALRLKQITANGRITITRDAATVTAERIDYDPTTEWMTATGTQRNPATFRDGATTGATTAEIVQWNTRTWNLKITRAAAKVR